MNTNTQLWQYHYKFFLEREIFSDKFVRKTKTHICIYFEHIDFMKYCGKNMVE